MKKNRVKNEFCHYVQNIDYDLSVQSVLQEAPGQVENEVLSFVKLRNITSIRHLQREKSIKQRNGAGRAVAETDETLFQVQKDT